MLTKSIYCTGASGFVGSNLIKFLSNEYSIIKHENFLPILINQSIVIHLAGKAHNLKNTYNSDEYYQVNTELTKIIFDAFLHSNAKIFIFLSSVKAVSDQVDGFLTEDHIPNPITHYGKSKLLAEQYILSKKIPEGKRVYILRPCMIHGPGNKGNLNLLFNFVKSGIPWPLGAFDNQRSFCSIDNLCFLINEFILNDDIPSGIYNAADDETLSTNEIISLISKIQGKKTFIWNVPQFIIKLLSRLGDIMQLPFNTERLSKLTETYIVSNIKIKKAINKSLPINSRVGFTKTLNSFKNK